MELIEEVLVNGSYFIGVTSCFEFYIVIGQD